MAVLLEDLSRGSFKYAAPTLAILGRAMRVDQQLADRELGLIEASIIALAEELGVYRLGSPPSRTEPHPAHRMTVRLVLIWYQPALAVRKGPERPIGNPRKFRPFGWSGKRDSDPRPSAWEEDTHAAACQYPPPRPNLLAPSPGGWPPAGRG